jgi:ABC-type multidrug transport system fused ATPase/permease subunit
MVIDDMDMVVAPGSTAALVGKSGGGKTTVVSLLLRYYDVKGGSITFDGKDIRSLNLASTHRHIGLVMQDMQMFNHSIGGNIGYGLDHDIPGRVRDSAGRTRYTSERRATSTARHRAGVST